MYAHMHEHMCIHTQRKRRGIFRIIMGKMFTRISYYIRCWFGWLILFYFELCFVSSLPHTVFNMALL